MLRKVEGAPLAVFRLPARRPGKLQYASCEDGGFKRGGRVSSKLSFECGSGRLRGCD
jgi:hypothetical protein